MVTTVTRTLSLSITDRTAWERKRNIRRQQLSFELQKWRDKVKKNKVQVNIMISTERTVI